tara:strand:+ start:102 stop:797 length:696 start_codon:yes stop_codon:yes gene_type:complete
MPQSISKKRIYFYLLILLFLSSTLNSTIILKIKKLNSINHIKITGLNGKEKNLLKNNLRIFINKNIFLVSREEIDLRLKNNTFLDNYSIIKIFPSRLLINVKKTQFVGKTIFNGQKFYIGKNGKLTKVSLVEKEYNLPQIFGNFEVNEFLRIREILDKNGFNLKKIKKYYYFKNKRWDITNSDNIILRLPSQDIKQSLTNYTSLLKANKIISGKLIDLRMKNKIIISNEKR